MRYAIVIEKAAFAVGSSFLMVRSAARRVSNHEAREFWPSFETRR